MPDFQRFDPAPCKFPRPAVALLPALRWPDLGPAASPAAQLMDMPGSVHFMRGRYALGAAYRSAGVGPGKALLAPAYHCRTMIDPALALGAPVALYRLHADLSPDLDSVRALLAQRPAALVLTHYFGFEQRAAAVAEIEALCRASGTTLVEDCAHAWQVAEKRVPLRAARGHAIVASPYKIFAGDDGGVLWADAGTAVTQKRSLADELRGLRAMWARRRRSALPAAALPPAGARGLDAAEAVVAPSSMYQSPLALTQSLASSRWVVRRTRAAPMIARRRANYQQWAAALRGLPGGRPLFTDLPEACVPYMFPLLLTQADPLFFQLKQAALPIWRWDEMAVSDCTVAASYRLQLLHLPCHQDLDPAQMAWMTALVAKALA